MPRLDPAVIRARFPGLSIEQGGRPVALFDGPGGTQVPDLVIDAVAGYYREANANHGGAFLTSGRSDGIVEGARAAMADLLGARRPAEIHFGANMTTLTFHASRSIGALLEPGDEVVVTVLDHQANVDPWALMAAERGLELRRVDIRDEDGTLDPASLDQVIGPRTRVVAVGAASNALGTVNPVAGIVERAHAVGALTYVDAVHYAPHAPIDVVALDSDFLVCSAYKFFGPHAGVLHVREDVYDRLPAYKVRPADDKLETGTGDFEAIAGTAAAVEYLAWVGRSFGDVDAARSSGHEGRRAELVAAMTAIAADERELFEHLADGLARIPGVRLLGIADPTRFGERTPTAAVTIEGIHPRAAAEALGRRGIATWDGDFYATGLIERLGLASSGGVLRIGLVHYNTAAEVDRLLGELEAIAVAGATGRPLG
jgi:cysteine desulfurase family protein (TIGR01976 family)